MTRLVSVRAVIYTLQTTYTSTSAVGLTTFFSSSTGYLIYVAFKYTSQYNTIQSNDKARTLKGSEY